MTKPKRRRPSAKTVKALHTLSGNQCAHPECTNRILENDLPIGHICHIYAVREKGPRGKPGLTEKELNSPENLILLCPNHHSMVDGQPESYPAEELKQWKSDHEDKMRHMYDPDLLSRMRVPKELVDEKIEEELEKLRKSRFFAEFDNVRSSLKLARRLEKEDLSWGSDSAKSRALAWCARLLSLTEKSDEAQKLLDLAKSLNTCAEVTIAEAFVSSKKDGKKSALKILSNLNLPASHSAGLMIVANHEGMRGAIEWLKTAGVDVADLDSDGKYFLLKLLLKLGDWEGARRCVDELADEHVSEAPTLHYMMAMTYLLKTVPEAFRASVFKHPPLFYARDFPLASDETSVSERWKARNYFVEAGNIARDLNCPEAVKIYEEYALWLELVAPDKSDEGKRRLESMLRDPERALGVVHLALEFGIDLDRQKIEREIEKQAALRGETTFDAARARLALILTEKNPEHIASQIELYEDDLEYFFDRKLVLLLKDGLSKADCENIQKTISAVENADTVESAKREFEKTGSLKDLRALVFDLESKGRWEDLCEYGEALFKETLSLSDAQRLANALSRTNRTKKLVEFIRANSNLLEQSENLRRAYCWALYHEGELLESRSELERLNHDQDEESYRVSRISLSVRLGDWNGLSAIIAEEYSNRDKKTARQLIEIAELAVRLKLPMARELVTAGAEKEEDDIAVLSTAYLLASEDGWEDDPKAVWWLRKAASLSGEDGPVRKASLRDMVNINSEWNQQNHEIWRLYASGEIPIFFAAHYLNRSVANLTLFRALTNLSEGDPRRRGAIPAYSGNRVPARINTDGAVGFDATALLTLGFLGRELLERALDAFKTVYIPHSTLAWLFEEKQKVNFHQPSRIINADKVRDLLAGHKVEKLAPSAVPDGNLSAQIGEDLAVLIAEAENPSYGEDVQRLVVLSSPVYRVASFMEEEADLATHEHVLCGCAAVIDKLREKGWITDKMKRKAHDYMRIHEKNWPNQLEIKDGAVLYLDDLSVAHFLHLKLFDKLRAAGFRLVVSPRTVSEADEFISYKNISVEASEVIETIRDVLCSRIKSGEIKLARHFATDGTDDPLLRRYPIADMFSLAGDCAGIIVDDRAINQHASIGNDGIQVPVFTTLDLIDELVLSGSITQEDWLEHRNRLRQAGYFFVPVTQPELNHHLEASAVRDGGTVEALELKTIRENILCIQMSDWLQFPKESLWADMFLTTFALTLKGLWGTGADLAKARVFSEWIVDSVDLTGWFQNLADKNKDSMNPIEYETLRIRMLTFPTNVPPEILKDYWTWAEDRILARIKEQRPDLYSCVLGRYTEEIPKLVEMELAENPEIRNDPGAVSGLADAALQLMPPMFRDTFLRESDFCKKYELKTRQIVSFGMPEVRFQHSKLCDVAQKILSGKPVEQVIDEHGQKWELKNMAEKGQLPILTLFLEDRQYTLSPSLVSLSLNKKNRLRFFEEFASALNLPSDAQDKWRNVLEKRVLEDGELQAFENDFINTPVDVAQSIHNIPAGGRIDISFLVPFSEKYFDRLVGRYDGSATIENYAATDCRKLFQELSAWRPYEGFLLSLLLSSHSALTDEIPVEHLDADELAHAFDFLGEYGDRLSQLGAIEVGLRIVQSRPEIETALVQLVKKIRDDGVNERSSGFNHLQALFWIVDGEISRTQLLSAKPPFYRKLAALSQAALINRQMVSSHSDIDSFCQSALVVHAARESYLQSLADMYLEPRWIPDFWTPAQIKASFLGRIAAAAGKYKENIEKSELYALILGTGTESIQSAGNPFYLDLPGPLEGSLELGASLPAWAGVAIEEQVNSDKLSPLSFGSLVNSARCFRVGPAQTELVVKALKRTDYQIADLEGRLQLLAILDGLAAVAAVAKSRNLADELRILVRKYRHDAQYPVPTSEDMKICLMAAASCTSLDEWREFVSDWMEELAFGELKSEDGELLHSHLLYLCRIVPGLRVSCGKTLAALKAYNALPAELKSKGEHK